MNSAEHIVYDKNGTRYEIAVSLINSIDSDYDKQYLISLVNFNECYSDTQLNSIGQTILDTSKNLGGIDAQNIQNAIYERFDYPVRVKFDHSVRALRYEKLTQP